MKTLFNPGCITFRRALCVVIGLLLCSGLPVSLHAKSNSKISSIEMPGNSPWNICWDETTASQEAPNALACIPNVNVSLNQDGFAVLTSLELVAGPEYLPFQYTIDIMGPLTNTVFCAQLGQNLMVVVTDPTGNSCMSTVHVEDKLRPLLTCTPSVLPCNVVIADIDFEQYVTVDDNCDPDPDLYYSYVIQNLGCNANGYTQQILITWTATDASGNSATCQDVIYLQKPSLGQIVFPPDVSLNCVNANIDPSNTGEPTFNGEPLGFACQIMVFYTDQVIPMCNGAQKIIRLWTVMDWCNSGQVTDMQEILIIDNVPPVITCPSNITLNTDMGVCTTKYTLPLPVVTDACSDDTMIDIDFFVSGVPGIFAPGAMVNLGLGTTLVTIRATDACGNSSTCHYNVTVKDQIPPVPICHSVVVSLGPDGMGFIVAATLDFPVIENCGILSKQVFKMVNTCNTPEDLIPNADVKFCCADVGQTIMVGFKVTDLSGNMNTCMFQVTVVDNIPPVAECKDITISINNQGSVVITPGQINDGSTDNCTITNITVTPNTFTCEDVGANVVVLTVTDQSGNTATCTATVTITDQVPPVAICENVTITLDNNGNATITAELINNGSTDNCAIDTIFLNEYNFDCDDEDQVNIVTLTVTDFGGNTSTCTATVTVLSNPPVAICHNITVDLGPLGTVTITADTIDNGSTDDCAIDTITVTPQTFDCADIGVNIVTLTVTDNSGNTSTCTATVTVEDDLPPIAICQNISVMLDENGEASVTAVQINNGSSDNCGDIDLSLTPTDFDCDDVGPNIVVLTVTDDSGNTSTCTAIVTVLMPDPPIALCQDITVVIGPGGIVTIDPEDIDNGSSTQCGDLTFDLDEDTFDCTELGPNVVTLTVTDETGASSTCTATVTVNEAPPVAICTDVTLNLDANGNGTLAASAVDDGSTDDCGIDTLFVTPFQFDCDDIGDQIVTLTVEDQSGNTSTCTATVTVEDNLPPVAICQNITVAIGAGGSVVITGAQVDGGSTDNCDDDPSLSVTPNTFDCEDLGLQVVTLTVTDDSGNMSTCTASVTVTAEPPTAVCQDITVSLGANGIVVILAADVDGGSTSDCGIISLSLDEDTFDCTETGDNIVILTVTDASGATSTCTATVTVVDDLDPICSTQDITVSLGVNGDVTISATQVNNGSSDNCPPVLLGVTPSSFDCDDIGDNVVVLTVTDNEGNSSTCTATVTVEDNLPPVAICQNITVSIGAGGSVVITGVQIDGGSTDNCDDDPTLSVTPNTFDCEDLGVQIVTLTVTDDSGNTSTCTASVTITAEPPTAVCQDITVSLGANGLVVILPADVDGGSTGDCGDITLSLDENTFDCSEIGDNIVILTVTDEGGATSTCTATVTVVDDLDPICNTQDITVFLDAGGDVTISATQVNNGSTDNCPPVQFGVTPAAFDCDDVGDNVVVLTVSDDEGNTSTCTATVTVLDTISPLCATQDITVSISGSFITILPSQVDNGSSDECGPVTLDVDPDTFDCDDLGENTVVLTVTDESGNTSTCTATVTVTDNGGLAANCQNVTIFLDANGNASIDPDDINNGSGGGCGGGMLEFDLSQTDFTCDDQGPNIVTLTVTDELGNTATCTAVVTVVDNMNPTIQCPPNVTIGCDVVVNPENTSQFGNATGSDNCPPVIITETHILNLNDCNVGTIIRTFTATDDAGNTATCTQLVTINNPNPFTEADITWPASPLTVNICNSTNPPATGVPVFDPASLQCANPVANFTDQVQTFIDNDPNTVCRIITRTWVVTDNCQPNVTFTFVQTINVVDPTPPVFTNINDMTKVANANCVAAFTLIASATDCAGVTITNNSPFGQTSGANASGNYPIGVTTVIFTATDGCGNISTMDVVITVTDPDPTEFFCEKLIIILPPETEIAVAAHEFITFVPGTCSDENDFVISYSNTNPFDTVRIYDCGDVGVTTFSLYFWNLTGTMLVDSCDNADLDLRDPDDNCEDGLIVTGEVLSEHNEPVKAVDVFIPNATVPPVTTDARGGYIIEGLQKNTGYKVAPWYDQKHREGVSTLDLVLIQKHLLGRGKLKTPYQMIAADANHSDNITALDLLEIRKLILGIYDRFPENTSWRFVDQNYEFPDRYNPFSQAFAESTWIDSITQGIDTVDFVGIKIGDVNGSYFLTNLNGSKIEKRSDNTIELELKLANPNDANSLGVYIKPGQAAINGLQVSLYVGDLYPVQLEAMESQILTSDEWYYDEAQGLIRMSWASPEAEDLSGRLLMTLPVDAAMSNQIDIDESGIRPEAYIVDGESAEVLQLNLSKTVVASEVSDEYQLFQNRPNPFSDGTTISFTIPQAETVRIVVYDLNGKSVLEQSLDCKAGKNEMVIKGNQLTLPGLYYYSLHTANASFTRKMTLTSN